ncbi:hypothetical protein HHI36_012109 [Cryptolaemus montrouzieri]|uniref:CLIP domain-containing serine protease n=1 Tax=Cryptolaemus montrouzieri TaxID=559131 RepID=A0ABD2NE93_9CUCU
MNQAILIIFLFFIIVKSDKGINQACVTPHGQIAKCVELSSCKHLYARYKAKPNSIAVQKYLRKSLCGWRRGMPLVCCGPKVDVYEECGNTDQYNFRITGGTVVKQHFPWMAALQYKEGEGKEFKCAGFLINPHFVLTAAHCVKQRFIHSVHLGVSNLTNYEQHGSHKELKILNITYGRDHRQYIDDIALIRIEPIKYSDTIRWICLPDKNMETPDWFTISGWGENNRMVKIFTVALQNRVKVTKYDDCHLAMNREIPMNRIICAGGEFNIDSCKGDSGGALMNKTKNEGWTAYGIISFGSNDCTKGYPAVHTKIQYYLDWIDDTMMEMLSQP